jgi:uncharacterized spore protein YtfJ
MSLGFPLERVLLSSLHQASERRSFMDNVKDLLQTTLEDLEKVLSARTVVGDPITIDGNTIIPLSSIGFGFGAGGGSGTAPKAEAAEGAGAGTGGGGGIKPVGVIIVNKDGVRVESIKGGTASLLESVGSAIGKAMENKAKEASKS